MALRLEPSAPAGDATTARFIAASVTGQAHLRGGMPCQDAYRIERRDGLFAIAVADGLGSAAYSDLGAHASTIAAAERGLDVAEADPAVAAAEGVLAARVRLEELAQQEECRLSDLACTLIVAVRGHGRVGIAHIGDGAVVGAIGDDVCVLSPPATSEYVNEVQPLTATDWLEGVRIVSCVDSVEALGVFTDGCQHAALRRDGVSVRAHAGFFGPLVAFARSSGERLEGDRALAELLAGTKMSEHSDDDKTLVIAVL